MGWLSDLLGCDVMHLMCLCNFWNYAFKGFITSLFTHSMAGLKGSSFEWLVNVRSHEGEPRCPQVTANCNCQTCKWDHIPARCSCFNEHRWNQERTQPTKQQKPGEWELIHSLWGWPLVQQKLIENVWVFFCYWQVSY